MNYLKDFVRYNKKSIIIGIVLLIISIILIIYFTTRNSSTNINPNIESKYELVLFGDMEVIIYINEEYQEPGYYAVLDNQIVTDKVKIQSNIDTSQIGTYFISYTIGNIKKTRTIKIIENPNESIDDIKFELLGDLKVTIYLGEEYQEPGYQAIDKDNNDISNLVSVKSSLNTNILGVYEITYSILIDDQLKTLTREVEVKEKLGIELNYIDKNTNQDILVSINALGSDFVYLKLPDGKVVDSRSTTFTISSNGTYVFYVYDSNGNSKQEIIQIKNIDKEAPVASCVAKVYSDRTEIQVSASDNVGIDRYIFNDTYVSAVPNYTINEKLTSVTVLIYDKSENSKRITCSLSSSYMEVHFIAGVSDDDAILIRTSDKTIMIDGGRYEASSQIVSYLQKIGVTKIDALIGSHVHWNHVQAQAAILDNFEVENAYYSVDILNCVSKKDCRSDDVKYIKDKLIEKNINPIILEPKDFLQVGEMKLYFIGPVRGLYTTYQNANSLVFILQFGDNKFMFTGDTPDNYMDVSKFQANASYFNINLDIDVLKWPHHGYETLTDAFFKATTPKYAIIPNCCWCTSQYPSSTNKSLMSKYGTTYYQVCDSKNIVLVSDGKNITINTNQNPDNWRK